MLSLLTAALLAQAPLGVGQVPTSQQSNFPAANYPQHLFGDSTKQCVQWSFGGTGWRCLLGEGDTATSAAGIQVLSSPPSSPATGRTYFDSTKGCQQTWTGAAWSPADCPISSAPTQPTPPNTLLSPASSPPSTSVIGATYFDTSVGCLRTWNGTTYNTCPSPAPTVPQIFLAPAASDPATSTIGATYFNTSGKCLKTWNGTAWSPVSCSNAVAGVPSAASPPIGTAAGDMFYDTALKCARKYNGTSWGNCLTTQACVSFTASGLSIPFLGVSTAATLITFPGAIGGSPCHVTNPGGAAAPTGTRGDCFVTSAANQVSVQWISNTGPLSALISIPNGAYNVCSEVLW